MYVGIDTYHDRRKFNCNRSVLALVASLNSECTKYYTRTCSNPPGQETGNEIIPMFTWALREYYEVNKNSVSVPKPCLILDLNESSKSMIMSIQIIGIQAVPHQDNCFSWRSFQYLPGFSEELWIGTISLECSELNSCPRNHIHGFSEEKSGLALPNGSYLIFFIPALNLQ